VEEEEEEEAAFLEFRVLRARAVFFECFLEDEDEEDELDAGAEPRLL
jgi:hypothetical protein